MLTLTQTPADLDASTLRYAAPLAISHGITPAELLLAGSTR